ncbi:hypothetical protein AC578_1660 [Pseudocercospora eumusae]|uniref:Uncharacterized protein n=1 Tax=Pseudocercospora eumusae TaxID=321146 RepID=A0A139HM82_9PEZI|nr:hypothetical protein AC578_1660 [Pseudocercospora eumusae]
MAKWLGERLNEFSELLLAANVALHQLEWHIPAFFDKALRDVCPDFTALNFEADIATHNTVVDRPYVVCIHEIEAADASQHNIWDVIDPSLNIESVSPTNQELNVMISVKDWYGFITKLARCLQQSATRAVAALPASVDFDGIEWIRTVFLEHVRIYLYS